MAVFQVGRNTQVKIEKAVGTSPYPKRIKRQRSFYSPGMDISCNSVLVILEQASNRSLLLRLTFQHASSLMMYVGFYFSS